jgi:two-component system, cell cycle sensor histidine kinase and response regulator CckA
VLEYAILVRIRGRQKAWPRSFPIDLTLTDVVMKGMTGPELVLELIDSYPKMKVVYMSGYTGELVAHQGLDGGIQLLEKPFTRAALLKILDQALGPAA